MNNDHDIMKAVRTRWLLCVATGCMALSFVACQGKEVGDAVRQDGVPCLVAAVDEAGHPTLWMTVEEINGVSHDSAMRWAAAVGDGDWKLPDQEQMQLLTQHRTFFNETSRRKGWPEVFGRMTFYWSSAPADETHVYAWGPYGLRPYFAEDARYRARAVKTKEPKK